jgi:sugar lactone lactonase YvrE
MSAEGRKSNKLLYVSNAPYSVVDIFSVPKYSLVGQITDGIDAPEGLATDEKGNLYVSNLLGNTITIYNPGATSPSLTLTESDGPLDVAVGSNGYVYAGDESGGIDVYAPGATSPIRRLTNPHLAYRVTGVAVGPYNGVFATGLSRAHGGAAVVKFVHARGSGMNLGLTGLSYPAGVIREDNYLIVSDFGNGTVLIYPTGQKSPSEMITVPGPERAAINKSENLIYVPEAGNDGIGVYDYPSGAFVTTVGAGGFDTGAALSPAPKRF